MLMTWNHNSGFNVHTSERINGSDGDAIERVARYMSRAAISVERVKINPDENTVMVYERQDRSPSCMSTTYTIMEFMALRAQERITCCFIARPNGLLAGRAQADQVIYEPPLNSLSVWFLNRLHL